MKKAILLKYLKIESDTDLKIILMDYQNSYVRIWSMMCNDANFDILAISLSILFSPTKLFWDLYLAQFLDDFVF